MANVARQCGLEKLGDIAIRTAWCPGTKLTLELSRDEGLC